MEDSPNEVPNEAVPLFENKAPALVRIVERRGGSVSLWDLLFLKILQARIGQRSDPEFGLLREREPIVDAVLYRA
jgi:hypothetical protein